ncbi:hypothetical protein ZIOFF_058085 [Zingiber officinale]|uniref:FH2 domain-containing protein n=1 Tax=Zingiber officinale TaxID=94328 RepID=A0A8J5F4D5_ZINOF|nr:hypothetical protein ZIOFF_058085 [Zingiber officinale]
MAVHQTRDLGERDEITVTRQSRDDQWEQRLWRRWHCCSFGIREGDFGSMARCLYNSVPRDVDAGLFHHVKKDPYGDEQLQRVGSTHPGGSRLILFCYAPHQLHRDNAQAFNLSVLYKLSDVKNIDGSMILLHFIVEEVVRSEGKPLVVNHNHDHGSTTLDRTTSWGSVGTREEREKDYIKLGLPVIGGISDEFASIKKVVGVFPNSLADTCASLGASLTEIKQFLDSCGSDGFMREIRTLVGTREE